ncbi:hypothetical protein CVT24_006298 [Panaeolus cyanescens]|uniref:MMS19 nucleotide excision repair protein n=1 Tax=Panaeolus cyanescens TaxID=181874 RepID=A0A409VDF4_9AGAR|nr:hypothetical protein CVT24_006298 [Panaeolus cyanescens]
MESAIRLVQTWVASEREQEIDEIVTGISNNHWTLLDVVKALGEYLTSEDASLLQKVRVLVTFLCGKLEDSETLKPSLTGLLRLASLSSFSPAEATSTIEALFQHVRMKSVVQSIRFIVFSILDTLMASHRQALQSMGKSFIQGYVSLAEGEKDPRNLMVAFAIARVILIDFDISNHAEAMFDIIFCYFPITFRPPPNDPYGISTDDLRLKLRACLSATPSFGPFAIPVFLEKLAAGSRATKTDTLQTMGVCIPVYGSAIARAYSRKLWNSLKLEIFQPVDVQMEEEALKTTKILVQTIYSEEEAAMESDDDIQGLARDACEECMQILKEPEKSQARPATKILCTFMTTTPSICRFTISQAVPHLVRLFHSPDELTTRPSILLLLSEFIVAARDAQAQEGSEADISLLPHKDNVMAVFIIGLKSTNSRGAALIGLKALVLIKGLLSDEELGFIVHNLNEVVQEEPSEFDETSEDIIDLLNTISRISARHVAEQTLPTLFSTLPDVAPKLEQDSLRIQVRRTLSMLQELCVQAELFEILVIRLTTKLDLLCFPSDQVSQLDGDNEPTAAYAHSMLKVLSECLSTKSKNKDTDLVKYIERLVPLIFNLFIASAFMEKERPMAANNPRLLTVGGEIINLVVRSRQASYASILSKALSTGDVSAISHGPQKFASNLHIFSTSSSAAERNILRLFSSAIIGFYKDVPLELGPLNDFVMKLLAWTLDKADTDIQTLSALELVSSLVNKRTDEELSSLLEDESSTPLRDEIQNTSNLKERRSLAIKAWAKISKALLVRKHPLAMSYAQRLFDLSGDEQIGWDAARSIGDLVVSDPVLSKANHADIKILYSQKYVNEILPKLIESANESTSATQRTSSLVALASLIRSISRAAYMHNIKLLVPLLLRGLDLEDPSVKVDVIETLLAVAEGDSPERSLVAEHSTTLVKAMLRNSNVQSTPSLKVRIAALRYLAVLPSIVRYNVLHPERATVLRELAVVLDDPKRAVRKAAVEARTNW